MRWLATAFRRQRALRRDEWHSLAGKGAILFKNGREVARQAGAMDAANIVRWARAGV